MSYESIKEKELVRELSLLALKDRKFLERICEVAPEFNLGTKIARALLSDNPEKNLGNLNKEFPLVLEFVRERML